MHSTCTPSTCMQKISSASSQTSMMEMMAACIANVISDFDNVGRFFKSQQRRVRNIRWRWDGGLTKRFLPPGIPLRI